MWKYVSLPLEAYLKAVERAVEGAKALGTRVTILKGPATMEVGPDTDPESAAKTLKDLVNLKHEQDARWPRA